MMSGMPLHCHGLCLVRRHICFVQFTKVVLYFYHCTYMHRLVMIYFQLIKKFKFIMFSLSYFNVFVCNACLFCP